MEDSHVFSTLESIMTCATHLQVSPFFLSTSFSASMESLQTLEKEAEAVLSKNSALRHIYALFIDMNLLFRKLKRSRESHCLSSCFSRQIITYKISKTATSIRGETRRYFDGESVRRIVLVLTRGSSDDEMVAALKEFENRLSLGFDRDYQELVLRSRLFHVLESIVCDFAGSKRIKEYSASCVVALVKFNRDVFVGLVLMGNMPAYLVSMASSCSLQALAVLVSLIRTPLTDRLELDGDIPRIVSLLSSGDSSIQVAVIDCVYEIAYFSRKESIKMMLERGLVEKMMELQFSMDDNLCSMVMESKRISLVAQFAIQIEVAERLDHKEKCVLKMEILKRVREAEASEAEIASVLAEVLWGSSP